MRFMRNDICHFGHRQYNKMTVDLYTTVSGEQTKMWRISNDYF